MRELGKRGAAARKAKLGKRERIDCLSVNPISLLEGKLRKGSLLAAAPFA